MSSGSVDLPETLGRHDDRSGETKVTAGTPRARNADRDFRSPSRRIDGSACPRKSRISAQAADGEGSGNISAPALKPRTSRWADEVDEDDQFIPEGPRPTTTRRQVSKEVIPPTPPAARKGYSQERRPDDRNSGYQRDSRGERRPDRGKGGKGYDSRPSRTYDKPARYSRPEPKAKPASQPDLEEITQMKEIMAKKAEEKKRVKEEEEARVEAERRARCEAKLREIEERKRSRASSLLHPETLASPLPASMTSPEALKREAFNSARRELRNQRERDRKGDERLDVSVSSGIVPPVLSPNAKEFVPAAGPMMPVHHWTGYAHHPMGHPPHHMPPMVQPPPHMPVGHLPPPQMPPGQMGYGYPQYPPHFPPYGYPHPPPPPGPHQMANHFY